MIDAVDSPAVSADIRDELFSAADCAILQDSLPLRAVWSLKIVPTRGRGRLLANKHQSYVRLRTISQAIMKTRVASPGREHCHSPVKGCWLARSHRHSLSFILRSHPSSSTWNTPNTSVNKDQVFPRTKRRNSPTAFRSIQPGFLSLVQGSPHMMWAKAWNWLDTS
jgi:hypothetical protein